MSIVDRAYCYWFIYAKGHFPEAIVYLFYYTNYFCDHVCLHNKLFSPSICRIEFLQPALHEKDIANLHTFVYLIRIETENKQVHYGAPLSDFASCFVFVLVSVLCKLLPLLAFQIFWTTYKRNNHHHPTSSTQCPQKSTWLVYCWCCFWGLPPHYYYFCCQFDEVFASILVYFWHDLFIVSCSPSISKFSAKYA